jgi:hypothetical protein
MLYKDPLSRLVRSLNESAGYNPGNLLIGQTVNVKITDLAGKEFYRDFTVELIYGDGSVILRDVKSDAIHQLTYENTGNYLHYFAEEAGVKYELLIDRDLESNSSVKLPLKESVRRRQSLRESSDASFVIDDPDKFVMWLRDVSKNKRLTEDADDLLAYLRKQKYMPEEEEEGITEIPRSMSTSTMSELGKKFFTKSPFATGILLGELIDRVLLKGKGKDIGISRSRRSESRRSYRRMNEAANLRTPTSDEKRIYDLNGTDKVAVGSSRWLVVISHVFMDGPGIEVYDGDGKAVAAFSYFDSFKDAEKFAQSKLLPAIDSSKPESKIKSLVSGEHGL